MRFPQWRKEDFGLVGCEVMQSCRWLAGIYGVTTKNTATYGYIIRNIVHAIQFIIIINLAHMM
jgi:hypothetical protein